ncbi:hypothetical protein [Niveispirillum sp. BGYR6]|uniref:hypothetical protein n=1 Tax=Niveispirillum sp. BGYR6 TaxID=2971249 RepID=UPI0022B9A1E4|nr:hypothetical protein [Niveispirillum sp. BGYR6]MDG5497910.1 hypothetical protein [Niveispirillum sp. BGYR6]
MPAIPKNLSLLHAEEEALCVKSIALIEGSKDMSLHVSMIEQCMDALQYVRVNTLDMSEDQLIVALIGASLFNSMASAMKLLLSGYYQSSGLQIRYILESGWLLDYLRTDAKLVRQWKETTEDKRLKLFGPNIVRKALDKRDGFKRKNRDAHYKRLCNLCGHPTFAGFAMLRPNPTADAHMGPMLVPSLLEGCIQELVQVSIIAAHAFTRFFPPKTQLDYKARLHFLEAYGDWREKVFGKLPDPTPVNQIE